MEAASPSKTLSGAGPARLHCGWDVPRRPRPAPPAVARPARAAALPRPGTRGDATPCADRPDRRPLALPAHPSAHGPHRTPPRAAPPAPGVAGPPQMRRPSGAGLLCLVSQLVVVGWVLVKCCVLSGIELARALLRFVADPLGESARGWRWLAIKVGISVWLRELFTLAAARDLYAGVL